MTAPASSHSITELEFWNPHPEVCPVETRCSVCRQVRVLAWNSETTGFSSFLCTAVVSPGLFYSFLSPTLLGSDLKPVIETTDLEVVPRLFGLECALVRVRIGLPVSEASSPRLFTILALAPLREVPDAPRMIHLGSHFFHEHRARLELDNAIRQGRLLIPW
jgi:hypothetical protein